MLENILGNSNFDSFINEYFEIKPFFLKGESPLYKRFNIKDFDQYLISGEGSLHNRVRISKNGDVITIPSYSGMSETQREFVLNHFKNGATLKLEDLDSRNEKLSELCKFLENIFGGYCFAKPFLTGANHEGLDVHFDTTEVFVVQLEGTKSWKVWPKLVNNPTLPMQSSLDENELPAPTLEVTLEKGDILYLPAGTPHCAKSLDNYSLHMAVGLSPIKVFEVIEGYIRILSEYKDSLRQNIYPWSDSNVLCNEKSNILNEIIEIPFKNMLKNFKISYNATKHETSNGRLESIALANKIQKTSKLQVRIGADLEVQPSDGSLSIFYSSTIAPGKPLISSPTSIQIPSICHDAISFIDKTPKHITFSSLDLPETLDEESNLILCQELVRSGVLIVETI